MTALSAVERGTRLTVAASAAAALIFQAYLGGQASHQLPYLMAGAFLSALAGGRFAPRVTSCLVLGSSVVLPAVLAEWPGYVGPPTETIWIAAVFGLALAFGGAGGWALRPSWRLPLAMAALLVALTWPIIVAREIDFVWALLNDRRVHITRVGIAPAVEIVWILYAALTLMVGVLWIDGLFRRARSTADDSFETHIVAAFLAGIGVTLAVAFVQMFVDVGFLNQGYYTALKRASGLLRDANAFGMLVALWSCGALILTLGRGRWGLAAVSAACTAAGVWGSGSRTALLAFLFVMAGALVWLAARAPARHRLKLAAVLTATVVMCGVVLAFVGETAGPLGRLFEGVGDGSSVRLMLKELWERGHYGSTAAGLIELYPFTGVGIGGFHSMVVDYAFRWYNDGLPPENAQNLYRHLVVELGWAGAAFWFWWLALVVWGIVRGLRSPGPVALIAGGAFVGFLAASLLGVPSQQATVFITVSTIAYWIGRGAASSDDRAPRVWAWLAAFAVVLALTGGTAYVAVSDLRVPFRAGVTHWQYNYGISDLDGSASPAFRWTGERAVSVISPAGKYLKLRFRVQHPDVAANPVGVKIKLYNRTIVRERILSSQPVVRYIEVPPDGSFVALTFEVSRTFTPGGSDPRSLGLAVDDWVFVDQPPADAWIIR